LFFIVERHHCNAKPNHLLLQRDEQNLSSKVFALKVGKVKKRGIRKRIMKFGKRKKEK